MKKYIIYFLITCLVQINYASSEPFNFNVTEIIVLDNGNIFKGVDGGKVTTDDNIEITADKFELIKDINLLTATGNAIMNDYNNDIQIIANQFEYKKNIDLIKATGNVVLYDKIKNAKIYTNEIYYNKGKEEIYTKGITNSTIDEEITIKSSNVLFRRNENTLSSSNSSEVQDKQKRLYKLDSFKYFITEELLKGTNVKIFDITNDEYFMKEGFFDLKKKKFSAKDLKINFKKDLFDDIKNDPRLLGVTASGDDNNIFIQKGVFTTCKKTDKCPPWKVVAKEIHHDKSKKRITYKNAWLNVYDVPVVYFPKFFHPDPTVIRQSGFLRPNISNTDTLGRSLYTPYFFVIDQNKDLTFKPTFFLDGKFSLQSEYRQKTKNTKHIADISLTKGYKSDKKDNGDTKSHFFLNSEIDLAFDSLLSSKLDINLEKTSSDTYLKIFEFNSPLLLGSLSELNSSIKLELENENFDLMTSFEIFETLSGSNSDRFTYVLPNFSFSKNILFENFDGNLMFTSSGNNKLYNTNINETSIINDLNYESNNFFSKSGFKNKYTILLKNVSSIGKNSIKYKESVQSDLSSAFIFDSMFPLEKENNQYRELLTPKISLRFNPSQMKNYKTNSSRLDTSNLFSKNRIGISDTLEAGRSITMGLDYENKKRNITNNEHEDFLKLELGTVLRDKKEENIPKNSTIGRKTSNIFGKFAYKPNDILDLNYNFSIDNDLNTLNYNSIEALVTFNDLTIKSSFKEENGMIGSTNLIDNEIKYQFNDNSSFLISSRRNRKINLTEYYNMIYNYENDCLIANVKYRKKYYSDRDIVPSEELFFTLTIIPLTKYSPSNLMDLTKK